VMSQCCLHDGSAKILMCSAWRGIHGNGLRH
jgi:hypothetical protein